jgi:hypothetical protein
MLKNDSLPCAARLRLIPSFVSAPDLTTFPAPKRQNTIVYRLILPEPGHASTNPRFERQEETVTSEVICGCWCVTYLLYICLSRCNCG